MKEEPAKALLDQPEDAGGSSKECTDQEGKEHFAIILAHGRSFLLESNAFRALREDLQNFIHPIAKQKPQISPEILDGLGSEASPGPVPEAYTSLWSKASGMVVPLISCLGLKDEVIPAGHQRIRWKNAHGKWLYDDYIKHSHGALQALQSYLSTLTYKTQTVAEGSNSVKSFQPAQVYSPNSSSARFHSSNTSDIAGKLHGTSENPTVNNHQQDLELGGRSNHTLYLMVCIEKGRHSVELHQEPVTELIDDRQLFHTLQRVYYEHGGKFKKYWSLRTVDSIQFMKFTYGGHQYIDVRCHEEICETGKVCSCIPPAKLVHPNGTEYEFRPIPPKLSPPVGPRMMMDLFTNADHIKPNTTLIMDQLPKRTCGQLKSEYSELKEAWGILYKEDWHWAKIWWILAVGFFPPSLLFGIVWGTLKRDIQGAFGIAGWWMTGAMILIGIVGSRTWS
ncbi:uncharacterized protein P174DRAFT_473351 [Aspergillus novofumigatus IBT 16806]|uniref:Uncharacterized protein n=1 Tax=Aspergillus novofumigatus (strain IBT 16806) TaxID=1392255 RepID=A0A2I1BTB3_ASPN1|nr:uncharacterized protein P174DRAFT_473351 [Aspergillus novofumigatus IBT 16806]PKX88609.1 hypothetical protein P174DRAFT_473351 [Aspergillus novofumigatus IBT 16806]